MNKKPGLASISLDLDNQWSYMKIHGDRGWDEYPSYLNIFIPHVLDLLDELGLKITFFIVGKDTESEQNRKYLKMITERGHEVGNHSYNHESWLQTYSYEDIEKEITLAEEAIEKITGQKPLGFRGPGFSWSKDLLKVLESHGYLYDASCLPTWIGPLARMYYFFKSDLSKKERKARKELFGKFSDGFKKLKPDFINLDSEKRIFEIPVSTMPFLRIPFHLSYLIYLSNISIVLAKLYLNTALFLCKQTRTPVSFLLHPLDIIGGDQLKQLAFFPGMNADSARKTELFKWVISRLRNEYRIVFLSEFRNSLLVKNL